MAHGGDVFKMPRFPFGGRSGLRWGVEGPIFPLHLGTLIMYNGNPSVIHFQNRGIPTRVWQRLHIAREKEG